MQKIESTSEEISNTEENDEGSHKEELKPAGYTAAAQFVNTVSRDFVSAIGAANIDKIIEEEEEEEENEQPPATRISLSNESLKGEAESKPAATSPGVFEVYGENTKFILEPVVLDRIIATSNEPAVLPPPPPPPQTKDDDENGSVEIKVEEGYATRQMDEYFRQTIAAIKEELTKKLDKNNPDELGDPDDIGNFSEEDVDSDIEEEFEDDFEEPAQEDDLELNQRGYYRAYRTRRNILYQQLLSPSLSTKKKSTQSWTREIASSLVLIGFIINAIIIDGICLNYTLLFNFVDAHFKVNSNLVASMPVTLLLGFYLLTAPVANFLTKINGARHTAVVGTFISASSLLASSFQTNFYAFSLCFGFLAGKKYF